MKRFAISMGVGLSLFLLQPYTAKAGDYELALETIQRIAEANSDNSYPKDLVTEIYFNDFADQRGNDNGKATQKELKRAAHVLHNALEQFADDYGKEQIKTNPRLLNLKKLIKKYF